ncbi:hypothetical protein D9615_008695 [Tricholomella constricta]|uniref:Uncharacterized protein n=1 Tax=Tricholomella constricta TaxID=117010 RepID=A0A8H5H7W6_9AGAR|nr:hypothetical protein D9615_008695 [Tricholomella constricta]
MSNKKKTSKPKPSDQNRSGSVAPDNPKPREENPPGSGVAGSGDRVEPKRDVAKSHPDDRNYHLEDERSSARPQSAILTRPVSIREGGSQVGPGWSDRKPKEEPVSGTSQERQGVFPAPFDNISRSSVKMRDDEHGHPAIFGTSELTDVPASRSSKMMSTAARRNRRAEKKPAKRESSGTLPSSSVVDDRDLLVESIVLNIRMFSRDGIMPPRDVLVNLVNDAFEKCVEATGGQSALRKDQEIVVESIVLQLRSGSRKGVTPSRAQLSSLVEEGLRKYDEVFEQVESPLVQQDHEEPYRQVVTQRDVALPSLDTMEAVNQSLRQPRQQDETSSQARVRHAAYERAMNPPKAEPAATSYSRTWDLSGEGPTSYKRGPSCDDEIVTHCAELPSGRVTEAVRGSGRNSVATTRPLPDPRLEAANPGGYGGEEDNSEAEENSESEFEGGHTNAPLAPVRPEYGSGGRGTTTPRPTHASHPTGGWDGRSNPPNNPQYYGGIRLPSRTPGVHYGGGQQQLVTPQRPVRSFGASGLQRQGEYLLKVHGRYHATIDEKLDSIIAMQQGGARPGALRVPMPEEYNGAPSMEEFDTWLYSVLRWMEINQLGGQDRERERISYAGMYLKGAAAVWFTDNVDGIHRRRRDWTFKDVITGLYDRFIHEASLQDAYVGFERAVYSADGGINEFFHQLKRYAERMVMPPDPYTFKRRFMTGIPRYLRKEILNRGFTAETSRMREILEAGLKIEQANRVLRGYDDYEAVARKSSEKKDTAVARAPMRTYEGGSRPPYKPTGPGGQRSEPKSDGKKPPATPAKGVDGGTKPSGEKRLACFDCGSLEHFARSRKCPKNKSSTARLNAVRDIVDDTSDTEVAGRSHDVRCGGERPAATAPVEPEESETPLLGEQYESEGEDYALEQYEEYGSDDDRDTVERLCFGRTLEDDSGEEGIPLLVEVSDSESEDEGEAAQMFAANTAAGTGTGTRPIVVKKSTRLLKRPTRKAQERQCFTALVEINGLKAFTLFDSGCTAEAVSPEFAKVAKMKVHQLEEVVPLQLGTKGSRSVINYGTTVPMKYEAIDAQVYFDIVNLDKYDAIIGVALMRQLEIELDFRHNCVRISGSPAPTFTVEEETREMARRSALRRSDAGYGQE